MRATQILPKHLCQELLRLARLDYNWVRVEHQDKRNFSARIVQDTWVSSTCPACSDLLSVLAASRWLVAGPKFFKPTQEQCDALEQVEVTLELHEYSQPYPELCVLLPPKYAPFTSVLCSQVAEGICAFVLHSADHLNDITSVVAVDGRPMEVSLQKFDDDCKESASLAALSLRVAINSCLALSNFGSVCELLYPKEAASDARLSVEPGERGRRARERVHERIVCFSREVTLFRREPGANGGGSHASPVCHWRRGHWAMQAHGPHHTLRKRIFRPPVFVGAFHGDLGDTTTTYRG